MCDNRKNSTAFENACDQNTAKAKEELAGRDIFSYFLAADAIQPSGGVLKPASGKQRFGFKFASDGKPVLL